MIDELNVDWASLTKADMYTIIKQTEEQNAELRELVDAWMARGTCEADETETWICEGAGGQLTVHVMECTECGRTYEHVNGDYEYCPRCGRKRKDADA